MAAASVAPPPLPAPSLDPLWAIRGLLSFAAFTEFVAAVRCVLPVGLPAERDTGTTYVLDKVFSALPAISEHYKQAVVPLDLVSHTYGLYCLLNALIIGHAAVFAHYLPLVCLCVCAIALKLAFLAVHSIVIGSIAVDHKLIGPCVLGVASLLSALAIPWVTGNGGWKSPADREEEELVRRFRQPVTAFAAVRKKKPKVL